MEVRAFLRMKIQMLAARAGRLASITPTAVGIRPQDWSYAPSPNHFKAANQRLAKIDREVMKRLNHVQQTWATAPIPRVLADIALVERELDRARRAFGLFFEIFGQRGSAFAPSLDAYDAIAADCYTAIHQAAPRLFQGSLLKPVTYMEHGYSPATMRRGVVLSRLLGEPNPFPIIRIPWDRDNPWQAVFLHEVAHNLQADLGIWQENRQAVLHRVLRGTTDPALTQTYSRWHKEIFADLAALLLGGPAAAWGMAIFLANPSTRTLTYRPGGAHPTAYLRVLILAEMLRRMRFEAESNHLKRVWQGLYQPATSRRLPARLLQTADRLIPKVVDEIAYQTRQNLGQRALADIIPFTTQDQKWIKAGAKTLVTGKVPTHLPPRHLVSASAYALSSGKVAPNKISQLVTAHLANSNDPPTLTSIATQEALAA
ncbi:hypothetical protein [Acaryochloris sp. CCMEE 5410]|uniref:hypothetical protein n=1 Tax=Acaryochloris sp. CCMEE 5410 TaxID=310037 RepID=UPI0002485263|nr:hypothetical protein [Acaryochloris sp. CCMEE 5410]KAI9135125.1 hypothetical protein ON05_019035 [Acaryochloris sp. CCMEE 5410]